MGWVLKNKMGVKKKIECLAQNKFVWNQKINNKKKVMGLHNIKQNWGARKQK